MLTATAVARVAAGTTLTIAELIRPVDANSSSSAATMLVQYTAGAATASARNASGAATRDARPDSHRYAWLVRARRRSPSQPPARVATSPVPTVAAPRRNVA